MPCLWCRWTDDGLRALSPQQAPGSDPRGAAPGPSAALALWCLREDHLDAARYLSPLPAVHLGRHRRSVDPALCVEADLDPDPGSAEPDAGGCGPGPIGG